MRCPVCKAENAEGPSCRRCKVELSLLWQLEARRVRLLADARRSLSVGAWRDASDSAAEAERLRSGGDARELLAAARQLGRDFAGAWTWYQAAKQTEPTDACQ
jgi:hypothetical protein